MKEESKKVSIEEAISVIGEWGVDCDNFVACNHRQFLVGGDPTDNSIELSEYFLKCLKLVCDLGIKTHNMKLFELTTGKTGFSYERAYALCKNESEAKEIFKAKFGTEPDEIELLLSSEMPVFITNLSDEDWYRTP